MSTPDAPDPLPGWRPRLRDRRAVVVGGGPVAVGRVASLVAAGADVLVVAPELTPSLEDLARRGVVSALRRAFEPADLTGAWVVAAATGSAQVDAAVRAEAERRQVFDLDEGAPAPPRPGTTSTGGGRVSIVGGGPGDPELLTLRARDRLAVADVVVTDRLAPLEVLARLAPHAEVVDAAKVPAGPAMRQERIHELLVQHARAGRAVVRLKGGDPFVFGRGMEEVQALTAAGIPVEVVPGLTSAIAVPALAGIPVTHRGLTQGFTVVSGHVPPGSPHSTVDWAALARTGTTLVLLMAIENLPAIAAALLDAGRHPATPAACVLEGSTPRQRLVAATLGDLAETARTSGVNNPAVVVVGEVASLGWSSAPTPLRGGAPRRRRRVLVLGGARSGKSATAERMLAGRGLVEYVATGAAPSDGVDPEWAERVRVHRDRRPGDWTTTETLDLPAVLGRGEEGADAAPALVDCVSTWLAGTMDDCGVWFGDTGSDAALAGRIDALVSAWSASSREVVAVSSEVGLGVVPETASGRRYRDELGALNARLAEVSDEVWLCTAGIAQRLR